MKNLKNIIIATAVLTATTAGFVLAEPWTNPTTTAPGANADSPINTSASNQTKQGGLSLGSLLVNNNASVLGNLGIGTNPQVKLHVKGNAKAFVLEGNGHVYMEYHPKGYAVGRKAYVGFGTPSKNDFYINNEYSSGVDLTLAENGNIGIGTVTPSQKLDVKGHIEVDGGYISLIKPVTAGTWARGLLFRSTETGAYESGIGYYGTATNLQRMFLGFGGNPWTSTKGMYILPNGNIGIGTVTPSRKLDVNGEIMTRTGTLYLRNNTQYLHGDNNSALHYRSNHSSYSQMLFRDKENTVYGRVYGADNGQHFGLLDADGNWSYRATKDNHTAFVINNSEKMRILANGNVGIGTTAPKQKLDVKGHIKVGGGSIKMHIPSTWTGKWGQGLYYRDSGAGFGLAGNADELRRIFMGFDGSMLGINVVPSGNVGIGTTTPKEKLTVNGGINAKKMELEYGSLILDPSWGGKWNQGVIHKSGVAKFGISGSGDVVSKVFMGFNENGVNVIPNGNVGIGTSAPSYKLHVNGVAYASSWNTPSDLRYKKDIKTLPYISNTIMKLNPVTYHWNQKGQQNGGNTQKHTGFIAQELEKQIPSVVKTDKKGYKSVNYNELVPYLTKAIQEQQTEIKELKKQNKEILERLKKLEK